MTKKSRFRSKFVLLPSILVPLILTFLLTSCGEEPPEALGGSPEALAGSRDISFSEVIAMAITGDVESIEVNGDKLTVRSRGGDVFTSRKETGASVVETLERSGVDSATSNIQIFVEGDKGERLLSVGTKGEHILFADFERLSEGQKQIIRRVGTAEFNRRQSLAEGFGEQQQAERRAEQEAQRR